MTSKNTEHQAEATNGLDDIMQDVASQLSNDLYDIPQNTTMDKDLDSIDKKLTDTPDDLNLNDDDIINLLESDEEFDLPKDAGLSYEEPEQLPDNDFAATLAAESMAASQNTQTQAHRSHHQEPSQGGAEDPMLLLDDELSLDRKPAGGGFLGKIALVFAMLASGAAGYAVWQGMESKHQTQELISQQESAAAQHQAAGQEMLTNPLYDQKISQLEQRLELNATKLESMESRLDQQASSLEEQQGRLGQLLEEVKQPKDRGMLEGIQTQLKEVAQSLTGLDERLSQGQKALEERQTQLGKDLEQRFERLSQTAAPQRRDFGDVVVTEPPSMPPAAKTVASDKAADKVTATAATAAPAPKAATTKAPRVKKQMPAPKVVTGPATAATQSQAGKASEEATGPWVVNLVSTPSEKEARALSARLQRSGISPSIRQVNIKGKTWYRLHVDGFANAAAAKRYADSVRGKPGLDQAWAGKGN